MAEAAGLCKVNKSFQNMKTKHRSTKSCQGGGGAGDWNKKNKKIYIENDELLGLMQT